MKFGGTSVGTVESLRNVKRIVEAEAEPVIVVVSALGGITDKLILTAELACEGNQLYRSELEYITERHRIICNELVPEEIRDIVWKRISDLLEELGKVYYGIELVADVSSKVLDRVVSFGERMSSTLITSIINDAELHYSPEFILTEKWFGKHIPDNELTEKLIKDRFTKRPFKVVVMPGFISSDRDTGVMTNLGRGGSDFTAALVAAALDADLLDIWTDVDGFMSADPRIIPEAHVLPKLSFVESMDLCSFGAKVIYPPTIYPVFRKKIPIYIKNTFNPSAPGTYISDNHCECDRLFRGVTSIKDISLFSIVCQKNTGLSNRIFSLLSKNGVEVLLVARNADDSSPVTFALRKTESDRAEDLLRLEFETELSSGELSDMHRISNAATVSVVGENLKENPALLDRLSYTLQRENIEVLASAFGSSGITLTVVVKDEDMQSALQVVHDAYLSRG